MDAKLEHLFYIGLGSALAFKDKMEKSSAEARQWQERAETTARSLIDELAEKGEKEKDSVRAMLLEVFREAVNDLDIVTRNDLESLRCELIEEIRKTGT